VRRILGPRLFPLAGRLYLRIFVDYPVVARSLIEQIPQGAHVLDIGGGDGAPLNHFLRARGDLRVTMIDIAPKIGWAIESDLRSRVTVLPMTSIAQFAQASTDEPDCITILDVMHHVPPSDRDAFFCDLGALRGRRRIPVIIKDVEPDGSLVARLNYLADRYVSGDRTISMVRSAQLQEAIAARFGEAGFRDTGLYAVAAPHYAFVVT